MACNAGRVLVLLILLASAGQVRAQTDAMRGTYAAVEERTIAEYEFNMAGITRQMLRSGAPVSKITPVKERMKMLSYNRAVLFALCAGEAEKERPPGAGPVPPEKNLLLSTCLEIKLGQLQKFSQLAAYADFFFPERIEPCGEQARLPEFEKIWTPYAVLEIKEPKLYDFPRYNDCLMKQQVGALSPASPAAR